VRDSHSREEREVPITGSRLNAYPAAGEGDGGAGGGESHLRTGQALAVLPDSCFPF
jgi:hypothetical protein